MISLYFHIPFCRKKCDYCHFYVVPDKLSFKATFMQGLRLEWLKQKELLRGQSICSVYFGGGTPYLLGPDNIAEILSWVKNDASLAAAAEVTLEANPEDMELGTLRQYAAAGVNRLSIGVQSLDDILLRTLSRAHTAEKAAESVMLAKKSGFHNISIDLMYDLPGQTLDQWQSTLSDALYLPITHLSLYNLVFEPQTVFYKKKDLLKPRLPNEETSSAMYRHAVAKCAERGLEQYEISAFGVPGCRSEHNTGYWTGRPFLGLGPSAFSYWEGKRFRNAANLNRYHALLEKEESPVDFVEELQWPQSIRELFLIRLRMLEGVAMESFQEKHGLLDEEALTSVERLRGEGFLYTDGGRVRLTEKGVLFYDTVASEII